MSINFAANDLRAKAPFFFSVQQLNYVRPHWHAAVEILLILSGSAVVRTAAGDRRLERDDILLINSLDRHEIRCEGGCDAVIFCLELDQLALSEDEKKSFYFRCDSAGDPDRERYANLKTLLTIAIRRNLQGGPVSPRENHSFAYSIYLELAQKFAVPAPAGLAEQRRLLERMEPIVDYVSDHFRDGLSLKKLAEAVHLTPTYLSAIFTKNLGVTFSEYYNSVRLDSALRDLRSTDEPIDLVAARSGFSNAQAFVRAFKSVYGQLPSAYRRQYASREHPGGIDMALVQRHLPKSVSAVAGGEAHIQTVVNAQFDAAAGTFPHSFRRLLGIGSAKQILMQEVRRQLEDIQAQIGFEYIKFHGIFSDEMMVVSRDVDGSLRFSFKMADMVFDYLFSIGLKPVLQLSFMPVELAEDPDQLIYNGRYNTSQPKRVEDWCALVKAFMEHLLARYGRAAVAELPVLVWNNADTPPEMFGMQDERVFFRLYRDTFRTVKALVPEIPFGAPPLTFMRDECVGWAERFFAYIKSEGVRPDFFCGQLYGEAGADPGELKIDLKDARPDHIYHGGGRESFSVSAGVPMPSSPAMFARHLAYLREFKASVGLGDLPLWITEFNLTFSHRQKLNDTLFAGCFVMKTVLENADSLAVLGYWSATDFIEEQQLDEQLFHGGLGLVTVDGIRKPQFLAYETLRHLKPTIVARGEGYLISREEGTISILMYNYEHFSDIYAQNMTYNMTESDRYTPFTEQRRRDFQFRIEGLGHRQVTDATEFIINRTHGSAFDKWVEMGSPIQGVSLSLDRYRLELLRASAYPLCHTVPLRVTDGILDYGCTLEPLEYRLALIHLK